MDPRIADYIRANRRRYTREAITKNLEAAGHPRAEIEQTWAALDAPDPDATVGEGFWPRFWVYLIGLNVGALLLVALLTGMFSGVGTFVLVVLGVVLAIGAAIALAIVAATRPTEMGRGTAIAVGGLVPLLFTFLIAGSCYALVGGSLGGSGPPTVTGTIELRIEPPRAFEGVGTANCQLPPAGSSGFAVFAEGLGTLDGRMLFLSIDSFGAMEGGELGPAPVAPTAAERPVNLFIGLAPVNEADPPEDYHTGPGTELDADVAAGGLSGTIDFENLTASTFEQGDAISGSVSWDCTQGEAR